MRSIFLFAFVGVVCFSCISENNSEYRKLLEAAESKLESADWSNDDPYGFERFALENIEQSKLTDFQSKFIDTLEQKFPELEPIIIDSVQELYRSFYGQYDIDFQVSLTDFVPPQERGGYWELYYESLHENGYWMIAVPVFKGWEISHMSLVD